MRSVATYQEHIRVKSDSTKGLFLVAHGAFAGIEELIDSRPNDEQAYDYLQARINALQARKMSPNSINIYFSHIKQYLHYRGIKLDPIDIKQCLNFPKKQVEELRPLEMDTFRKMLNTCSAKREMLYLAQSSSGMRIGEMMQLRKKDIHTNMARLMVKIPAAFTKTGVARTTFFSAEAAQLVAPRLKKIGDLDPVFGTDVSAKSNARCEAKYIDDLQKKMGISDKYETNGRNVITTHSFRAFFITKVSRHDANLARYFAGQKGYLQQYDRQTDAEKLDIYMEFEPLLLVSDKARDKERIRNLENENSKVAELERKNREFERMAMEFERRTMESERRNKDLEKKFYELEDAVYKSITKQSGGLRGRPDMRTKATSLRAQAGMKPPKSKVRTMSAATGMSISERHRKNAMPADLASYTKHVGEVRPLWRDGISSQGGTGAAAPSPAFYEEPETTNL